MKHSVVKELEDIPKKDIKKIIKRIQSFALNPRPSGAKKFSDQERYRIRQGDYRIVYSIQDNEFTVHIYKIEHRREIYK